MLVVPLDSSSLLCLHRFAWVYADSELLKYPKPVAKERPDLAAFAALPLPRQVKPNFPRHDKELRQSQNKNGRNMCGLSWRNHIPLSIYKFLDSAVSSRPLKTGLPQQTTIVPVPSCRPIKIALQELRRSLNPWPP